MNYCYYFKYYNDSTYTLQFAYTSAEIPILGQTLALPSFPSSPLSIPALTYAPAYVSHDSIKQDGADISTELQVSLHKDNPVVQLLLGGGLAYPVEFALLASEEESMTTNKILFRGNVVSCVVKDEVEAMLTVVDITTKLQANIPCKLQQKLCPHYFASYECGISLLSHKLRVGQNFDGVIEGVSEDGRTITSKAFATKADNYSRGGALYVYGLNASLPTRRYTIISTSGNTAKLLAPIPSGYVGANFNAFKGCDGTLTACKAYENTFNFGGMPHIPDKNPLEFNVFSV